MSRFESFSRWAARMGAATATLAVMLALALAGAASLAQTAAAQNRVEPGSVSVADEDDPLIHLFEQARRGEADPHLPFVLSRLKRALADQDMLGFLSLVDPAYFEEQFRLVSSSGRNPGETLGQFACEFFSVCDIAKTYSFNDIVSMQVLKVSPEGGLSGALVQVTLELRMWDGLTVQSTVFYNTSNARLSAALG